MINPILEALSRFGLTQQGMTGQSNPQVGGPSGIKVEAKPPAQGMDFLSALAQFGQTNPNAAMEPPTSNTQMGGGFQMPDMLNPIGLMNLLEKGANTGINRADAMRMQLAGMKPPKARGAMRPGESGLLAGGMLLAKLLGADTGGVAQFAQGYTGARQQSADLDNANAAQQYASERENLLMQAQLEMEKAQRITAKAGEIRAQMFDIKKEKAASEARIQNFLEKQAIQQMADDADLQKAALDASTKKGIAAKQYEYYLTLAAGKNLTPERAQMIATAVEDFKNEQAWEAQKPDIKWAQTVLANPRSDTRDKILAAKKIARVEQNPVFASRFNPSGDPEFQSMWADPEIQKALAEASTYERRMMSLDKKDQALIENLTARTKLTMEQATQLAGMFELNKQAASAGIRLTNAKIAEAYARAEDLKNNPGGAVGRNDVAYAKLYLDLADGVRKRADSLAELYKYDDMPENAKAELSNLEAEYTRLRSEAELFVPGGVKSSVTSTGQPKNVPAPAGGGEWKTDPKTGLRYRIKTGG